MPSPFAIRPALAALALTTSLGLAHADEIRRAIATNGTATVGAKPDLAFVTIGVQTADKEARAALDANSKATGDLIAALKADGIEARDLQTSGFSVNPEIQRPVDNSSISSSNDEPKITGYTVSNNVNVTLRDLPRLGEILDKAVTAGANSIDGIQFEVSNQSSLLDSARKIAFEDARRKADVYAQAAGLKLGKLIELNENAGPSPRLYRAMPMKASAAPIETGESTLSVTVSARFQLVE